MTEFYIHRIFFFLFSSPDIVVILRTANTGEWRNEPNLVFKTVSEIFLWCNVEGIAWLYESVCVEMRNEPFTVILEVVPLWKSIQVSLIVMNRNLGKCLFRVSDFLSLQIILVLTNMVAVSTLNNNIRKYQVTMRFTWHPPKQQVSTLVRTHRALEIFCNYTHKIHNSFKRQTFVRKIKLRGLCSSFLLISL